jgi:hypothetical protein
MQEPSDWDSKAGEDWNRHRPGRYYVIRKAAGEAFPPWVMAEVIGWTYAETWWYADTVILSRREALALPTYAEAVRAWERRDDAAYERWHGAAEELIFSEAKEAGGVGEMLRKAWTEDEWRRMLSSGELDDLDG